MDRQHFHRGRLQAKTVKMAPSPYTGPDVINDRRAVILFLSLLLLLFCTASCDQLLSFLSFTLKYYVNNYYYSHRAPSYYYLYVYYIILCIERKAHFLNNWCWPLRRDSNIVISITKSPIPYLYTRVVAVNCLSRKSRIASPINYLL